MEHLAPADFRHFVELNAGLEHAALAPERRAALTAVVAAADGLLSDGPRAVATGLPRAIGEAMGPFGWFWNGFYVLHPGDPDELRVGPAFGPPVCASLERSGGPLSSGMCFDALHLNQTLAAYDAHAWPGYVSCDATSGLSTASGLVCPVRDAGGLPIAVWDLDAAQTITPGDVRTMDVLFATLARCLDFDAAAFTTDA